MSIINAVVAILLAVLLVASGVGKLARAEAQLTTLRTVQFPEDKIWMLATAEIAGALGLAAGLLWWPLGIAAAMGVMGYFIGAIAAHLRKRDRNIAPASVLLAIAALALALRVLTI